MRKKARATSTLRVKLRSARRNNDFTLGVESQRSPVLPAAFHRTVIWWKPLVPFNKRERQMRCVTTRPLAMVHRSENENCGERDVFARECLRRSRFWSQRLN